jgi:aspartate aminotransferase
MRFSSRLDKVQPSVTLGLNARTLELRKQGRDIIALGVGEPDIETPEVINQAGIKAIREHRGRYTATAGIPELRAAIAAYIKQVYRLDYSPDCVMASSGAKQVLFNSLMISAGPGDEVLIPTPYWTSYPEMVHLVNGTPVLVETSAKDNLKLTPETLAAALTTNTTALMLNSPGNPSGVTYTLNELQALGEVIADRELWILSDDIYCNLLFGNQEFATMAHLPAFRDRTILINGVSKTFSMTGWRIGFAAGSKEAIAAMTRVQDHATSCPSAIAQYAAAEALRQGPALTAEWQKTLIERRALMLSLANAIPGVTAIPPTGAFYLFLDLRDALSSKYPTTLALSEALLMDAGVGVIPGEAFGAPGYLRLSFAVDNDTIVEGMRRISNFLTQE